MIDQDFVAQLDGSPEERFFAIERRARQLLIDAAQRVGQGDEPTYGDFDYMVDVLAAAKEFNIAELADYTVPWRGAHDALEECRRFKDEASLVSQRLLYRHGARSPTVALPAVTKQLITHYIGVIRAAIEATDITREKKDRLLHLLSKLQIEVDRERTPVQAVGELWLAVCTLAGQGVKQAMDPVTPHIEKIAAALGMAKEAEESSARRLPPRQEPKQIEPPASPKKRTRNKPSLDDEIPF